MHFSLRISELNVTGARTPGAVDYLFLKSRSAVTRSRDVEGVMANSSWLLKRIIFSSIEI
ncbi:hypothetical protein [Legionella maioricensis]|uniref:Uncharacterized protein n=1 Tax=Legionella maioricensis TaxID=2896528 RepID=A0A9X2CZE9_9GAMM|nr:hypothetical protein [Legionella maioricensis]MCL9683328.1 hypothetical protein [Legionella maioricensis]MCL9685976.1 hypothetical protein [Legionella maioricensis]